MLYWHQVHISNRRQGNGPQIYWGHDLWPFWVTWRHLARDHSNPNGSFPIGGPLDPSLYLHLFSRYLALSILTHDLDLSGSGDAIGHVTIWFPGSHFLQVLHWHQVRISNRCRDNGPQIYWGHDLDLSGSRAVISHVTIWIPMVISYWWSTGPESIRFRDIWR